MVEKEEIGGGKLSMGPDWVALIGMREVCRFLVRSPRFEGTFGSLDYALKHSPGIMFSES